MTQGVKLTIKTNCLTDMATSQLRVPRLRYLQVCIKLTAEAYYNTREDNLPTNEWSLKTKPGYLLYLSQGGKCSQIQKEILAGTGPPIWWKQ